MAKKKAAANRDDETPKELPIVFLAVEIKTPPFSAEARMEAGYLLWRLQSGDAIPMPHNRPLPSVGAHCGELRIRDGNVWWRILYRRDDDVLIVAEVFPKQSQKTPQKNIDAFIQRLRRFDETKRNANKEKP